MKKSRVYVLYTESGSWLGQIVLTEDGMFSGVTDWGNFSYAWRAFSGDFRAFLIDTDVHYFSNKMQESIASLGHGRKAKTACNMFAERILPALKSHLKLDLELNADWNSHNEGVNTASDIHPLAIP